MRTRRAPTATLSTPAQRDQRETAAFHLSQGRTLVDGATRSRGDRRAAARDLPRAVRGRAASAARARSISAPAGCREAIDEFKVALWCRETAAGACRARQRAARDRRSRRRAPRRPIARWSLAPDSAEAREPAAEANRRLSRRATIPSSACPISTFREIQLSGKQLVFLFMASVVVLGRASSCSACRSAAACAAAAGASVDVSAATDTPAPTTLPPPTETKPGELGYHDTLQGQTAPAGAEPHRRRPRRRRHARGRIGGRVAPPPLDDHAAAAGHAAGTSRDAAGRQRRADREAGAARADKRRRRDRAQAAAGASVASPADRRVAPSQRANAQSLAAS